MAMEIFKLFGSIFVDSSEAEKSISKTDDKAKKVAQTLSNGIKKAAEWGSAIVAGASAAAAGIVKLTMNSAAHADEVDKMSAKIGLSKKAYQEWEYILGQNGMEITTLQTGMKTFRTALTAADRDIEKNGEIFRKLNIDISDSGGALRSEEEIMFDVISALADMEDQIEKETFAVKLFGKSGTEMLPMLNAGSSAIVKLKDNAHDLGLIMSDEAVTSGVVLGDTLDDVKRSATALFTQLGVKIFPIVQQIADYILEHMPEIEEKFEELGPIVSKMVSELLPVLLEIGNTALPIILDFLELIMPILPEIITWGTPIITILWGINAALTANPVGAVIAGIVLLIALFATLWNKCEGFRNFFLNFGENIKSIFKSVVNGLIVFANSAIDGLNTILTPIRGIILGVAKAFGSDLTFDNVKIPKIPELARGGVLQRGQIGLLEGTGAEAVVPLENNRGWIRNVARDMNDAGAGSSDITVSLLEEIRDLIDSIRAAGIYLDSGELVGGIAGKMNREIQKINRREARTNGW